MKKIGFLIQLFAVLLIVSCTEVIDIDLQDGDNNKLSVSGKFTNETKAHQVELKYTVDYFSTGEIPMVENARVYISNNQGDTINLTETSTGIYQTASDVAGIIGVTYKLNIELQNGEKYNSDEQIMPAPIEADSIICEYREGVAFMDGGYYVQYFGQETAGEGGNYFWDLYIDNVLDSDTLKESRFENDQFVDGQYIHDMDLFFLEEEEVYEIVDGTRIREKELKVASYTTSKQRYEYCIATMLETEWRGGMFDGPPANVPTNIYRSDGTKMFGLFSVESVTYKTCQRIIDEE